MPASVTVPAEVVRSDHNLTAQSAAASEALARFRWEQCLDPAGPQYPIRAYARAVGRNDTTITRYAKGWALFVERRAAPPGVQGALTIQDAIRLAEQTVEQQQFSEAIAEGSGKTVAQVARGDNRHRTKAVIEQARGRAERRGGEAVDHARDIAREEASAAAARRKRDDAAKEAHGLRWNGIEGHLAFAQRRLTAALRESEGVDFSEEEMALLRSSIANIRAVLDLIDLRMAGSPDIDWDAELAKLGAS